MTSMKEKPSVNRAEQTPSSASVPVEGAQKLSPGLPDLSLRQPPWQVAVMGAVTFKLYLVYWGYKNWRDLGAQFARSTAEQTSAETQPEGLLTRLGPDHMASFKDCSPLLRTIWMFVPYVNNYLLLTLALGIARIHPNKQSLVARHPLACSTAVVFATISLSFLSVLPGAWYLLFVLSVLPAAVMQQWLNDYWKSVEPVGLLYRTAFTLKELVVLAAGALFTGYIIVGFMMGAHTLKL